jgi:hypothetical protein
MRLQACGVWFVALLSVAVGTATGALAVTLNQRDDFQDGTTQGWRTGPSNPNPPAWVADGGPLGAGDGFLLIEGNGSEFAGGNLVAFNTDQWTGDYRAAGVEAVQANLQNLGNTWLAVRLLVEGPGGGFYSLVAAALPPGGGWQAVRLGVDATSLTGGNDAEATLSAVSKLRILHAPTPEGAEPIAGALGVDNMTAISGDPCLDAGLSGLARGLCKAYCEALDCDASSEAPESACGRLRALFESRTGLALPCERPDADEDGVEDVLDNCPEEPNADQSDADGDAVGDVCDNCPDEVNPGQEDGFGTPGVGDVCDCPCFTTEDVRTIAEDPICDPLCIVDRPTSLGLVALQCSTTRPDYSAVVELLTDFGGQDLCQLNLPPPDESVLVQGLEVSQAAACRAYVLEAGGAAGLDCR